MRPLLNPWAGVDDQKDKSRDVLLILFQETILDGFTQIIKTMKQNSHFLRHGCFIE